MRAAHLFPVPPTWLEPADLSMTYSAPSLRRCRGWLATRLALLPHLVAELGHGTKHEGIALRG